MKRYDLIETILSNSCSRSWENAVYEWEVIGLMEDDTLVKDCICGKENLKYLYTIQNKLNGKILFPIGASCIRKFGRADLNESISIQEKLFDLVNGYQKKEVIKLNSKYFSKGLLMFLYKEGAFKPNQYNKNDSSRSYEFMIDMFNMRNSPSKAQQNKIDAILNNDIKDYLKNRINSNSKKKMNK